TGSCAADGSYLVARRESLLECAALARGTLARCCAAAKHSILGTGEPRRARSFAHGLCFRCPRPAGHSDSSRVSHAGSEQAAHRIPCAANRCGIESWACCCCLLLACVPLEHGNDWRIGAGPRSGSIAGLSLASYARQADAQRLFVLS